MDYNKTIALLPTSRPIDIFNKIVRFNGQSESISEMGKVRIGLTTGFILEGTPVKMDADGNAVFISGNNSISYANVSSLAGIEILNPEVVMEVLTDGSFIKVPSGAPRTKLQLKRAFQSQTEALTQKYGFAFHTTVFEEGLETEGEKYQFEQFLPLLQEVLGAIEQDALGKAAILELEALTLKTGDAGLSIAKTGRHMTMGINFKHKFSNDFKGKLQTALESNL